MYSFQQVWSLLFPSWPSFVLLMWSCVVWVTPKFNAKDVVYYSTPLLVLYAIVLLLIQYLYNLDLTEGELESNIYAGLARYYGPPAGARVLTIALKVCVLEVNIYTILSQCLFILVFIYCHFYMFIAGVYLSVQTPMATLPEHWHILSVTA